MKICQLCSVDFTVQKFLLPLIDDMHDAGWEVTTVCSDGHYVAAMRAAGYRIQTIKINRSIFALGHLRSLWNLVNFLRRERFDVLHVHTPVASLLGRLAARIAGVPLVIYTAHGFYFHDEMPAWKYRLFVALERMAGRWTDFLFTQSTEDATSAVRLGIMPLANVLAIGNGVSDARFDPQKYDGQKVRAELGISPQALVIGIVGRLVREKGYIEFLQAAETLQPRFPEVYYLIVGERLASDHDAQIDTELELAKVRLGSRLKLAGMREDVPDLLSAMDIFCLPSYREGMPRTIIEAMMMGKPVVATNIRGSREEVVLEQTGLLVPTRNAFALTHAFARLLQSAQLRVRMGQAGRARALALYDEQYVVHLQINKIRELTGRKGGDSAETQSSVLEPPVKPAKVLVTGANGFLGEAVCTRLLAEEISVVATHRVAPARLPERSGMRIAAPYPLNETTDWMPVLNGVECVVHLAALAHRLDASKEMEQSYWAVNFQGTRHLANQAAAAGVRRFIYISTIKVNGERTTGQPFTEADRPNPQDSYALSKWEAEQALHRIATKTGMEVVILRPPLIYGPRVRANFLRMLNWVAREKILPLGAVKNRRSLLYLENFSDAVMLCLTHPAAANRTFLLSDYETYSTAGLARHMSVALGVKPHLYYVPLFVLRGAGALLRRSYEIRRLADSLEIDASEITRSLHWHPPYSLQQGLVETVRWYQEQGK